MRQMGKEFNGKTQDNTVISKPLSQTAKTPMNLWLHESVAIQVFDFR